MSNNDIITGVDLGSGAIRIAVGQVHNAGDLRIIGLAEGESIGINKGVITNIEDTVSSISACVEKAEKLIGIPIEHVYVGISGSHIISQESKGVIAISKADGEIKQEDVARVLDASKTVVTPANYEILHVLPRSFSVDNQPGIMDPIGMTGVRLEVDAQIIFGLSNQIKNLTRAFYRVGIGIDDLVFSVLATAESVLDKRQKELGAVVINLGSTTTSIAVFEEGDVLTAKVLPIGSRHITSDIAIGLRVHMDLAEAVKLEYGTSLPQEVGKLEQINFKDLVNTEDGAASRKEVAKIIEARCEEIFKFVDNELKKIDRSGKLPAGAVLTGAGSKLNGLAETARDGLRIPTSYGVPYGFTSGINKAFDTSFSTAVGLVLWGERPMLVKSKFSSVAGVGSKVKNWLKNLLPY